MDLGPRPAVPVRVVIGFRVHTSASLGVISPAPRPSLRLIRGALDDSSGWPSFGVPAIDQSTALARACGSYGIGLLHELASQAQAAIRDDDAFLVIDSLMRVQALSRPASRLLGVTEEDALDLPVARLLGPADTEAREPEDFLHLLRRASTENDQRSSVFVRPRNAFGVRMVARITPCGPPRGALVLLRTRVPRVELRRGRIH